MSERIPQSVAIRVPIQMVLSSDHATEATGKTVAVVISKNAGAYGNPSAGATNATEIADGSYYVDLSTTDIGTLGPLFVRGTAASCDAFHVAYNVVNPHNAGFDGIQNATAVLDGQGYLSVGVVSWADDIVQQPATSGIPMVDVTYWDSQPVPAPDAAGNPTVAANVIRSNTAQAIAAGTITLDAGAVATDNYYNGILIEIVSATTGVGQVRTILSYIGSTKVATLDHSWTTTPTGIIKFNLIVAATNSSTIGGLPNDGTSALSLQSMAVVNPNGDAVIFKSTHANSFGLNVWSTAGTGGGFRSDKTNGIGLLCNATSSASGGGIGAQFNGYNIDIYCAQSGLLECDVFGRVLGNAASAGNFAGQGVVADLVNAPNASAILAFQSGLSKPGTAQTIDGTVAVPTTGNTANTINDCLNSARAQGFGKWVIVGTTLTLYAPDGTTAVRTFTLDSSTAPTQRI